MSVPRLRLFGLAADAAGTRCDDVSGTSVDEILTPARVRYGCRFPKVVAVCQAWVDGDRPKPEMALEASDEVAPLPAVPED